MTGELVEPGVKPGDVLISVFEAVFEFLNFLFNQMVLITLFIHLPIVVYLRLVVANFSLQVYNLVPQTLNLLFLFQHFQPQLLYLFHHLLCRLFADLLLESILQPQLYLSQLLFGGRALRLQNFKFSAEFLETLQ